MVQPLQNLEMVQLATAGFTVRPGLLVQEDECFPLKMCCAPLLTENTTQRRLSTVLASRVWLPNSEFRGYLRFGQAPS